VREVLRVTYDAPQITYWKNIIAPRRVPSVLHTPLMSGANAIHGVVIIGAIIVMGKAESDNYLALILGFLAVILGTVNVVGGFVVTDRMLEMFKKKK